MVSYDSPVDMRKYVHRVGRTARAGREGDAWTLVEEQEVINRFLPCSQFFFSALTCVNLKARHFKAMMREAQHLSDVKRVRIGEQDLTSLIPHYEV